MTPALSALAALPLVGWSVHATALRHRLTLARRDPLTGLPTRDQFTARATRILRAHPALVVLVDLDRFKPLNDTHGHAAGDAALRAVAERLSAWALRGGLAARIGGDEFAAILPNPTDPEAELASLHWALTQPVAHLARWLQIGASIGARPTSPGESLPHALALADRAMYAAKQHGGGWQLTGPHAHAAPGRWKRHHPVPAR